MKGDLLKQAKKVVHNLLRIIDGKDKIVLRIISGGNSIAPSEFDCLKFLTEARPSVIKVLKDFLDRTGQTGLLEYAKVFRDSFRLFGSSNKKKLFILITSGEHDESYSQVKEYYKNGYQKACQASVVIFLVQGSSTPLITRQEHEGLKQEGCDACNDQNCDSFNKFQLVDIYPRYNEADIRQQVAKIYKAFQNELGPPQLQFSMPYEDFYGLGTMIDACTRVVSDDNKLLGVLCLSFLSNELFGVTAEVANTKDAYPFLIDKSGTTYIHPYYINPELHASGSRIDITNFETSIQFQNQVYNSMKSGREDEKSFNVKSSVPLGTLGAKFESKNFTYIWREVEGSSFSVGVAVSSVYKDDLQLQSSTTKGNELYHRLSLQDGIQDELCSHYGYIAIKDQPVVSIAPDSFEQPSVYYEKENNETVKTLQNYFNGYVENPTAFKSNTIRNEIRQAVMATNLMNEIWTGDESNQRLIIKWRYIGMENGVFRIFPGIEVPEFDPRQQQWYHLAETFPGKLVFTTPYKDLNDPSQASILSLSKQITEELSGVKQGSGVIGMDFEFRYFQFLIERDLTLCARKVIRGTCSIINTDGFLLYHNGTEGDLYKHIHLVEKEPDVARKLLQRGMMKKTSCIEYNDRLPRTIWFYSLDHITVSKSDNGTFWLVPIKGTNLLLLFTKHSNVEKEQEECKCSKPSLKGEVLGKCREGVDEASCDCPCYVEKACLSDLFETDAQRQSTLICQPRSMGQKMPDSTHLKNVMKNKMPLDACYPLSCSHFQRSDECNLYGCYWNAQQCSE
uniref:VWFA domain-containing protein n=1 Tax=Clytia hemisphaerica TaxID=252671 RepID=A0A7M5XHG0_9CNID